MSVAKYQFEHVVVIGSHVVHYQGKIDGSGDLDLFLWLIINLHLGGSSILRNSLHLLGLHLASLKPIQELIEILIVHSFLLIALCLQS